MRRIDKMIKILRDAERDFRLDPTLKLGNDTGLCHYIVYHPLLLHSKPETVESYLNEIFKGMEYGHYLFTYGCSQFRAWKCQFKGYNYERADWCKKRIKELKQGK